MHDAVLVHLRAREPELERRVAFREESLAGAERERIDEQVELVDQAVGEHRAHQAGAAADVEVAVELLLQAPDCRGVVRADDLRVAHVGSVSVPETTYFVVSLKNGAPGSSSTVRVDHAGSNISYVA